MTLRIINMDCIDFNTVWEHCERKAARFPHYNRALDYVYDAYDAARKNKLRFSRHNWTLRDNRLGCIMRPCRASDFPDPATLEEAREQLAHEVWGDAVRRYNVATL